MTFQQAFDKVKASRPSINPPKTFQQLLKIYSRNLKIEERKKQKEEN